MASSNETSYVTVVVRVLYVPQSPRCWEGNLPLRPCWVYRHPPNPPPQSPANSRVEFILNELYISSHLHLEFDPGIAPRCYLANKAV